MSIKLGFIWMAPLAAVSACSSDNQNDEPGDTTSEQGYTQCEDETCQPGQYCDFMICKPGCTSNENCAANQTCEDVDQTTSTGTCRNKQSAPEKDCNAFCDKAKACGAPETPEECAQLCAAGSSECVACMNDSNCGQGCASICGLD